MPEVRFKVRWPDGKVAECYSPSRVIEEHLTRNQSYALNEFVARSRTALNTASERVRAKYGYYCSSAMDQLAQIEATAEQQSVRFPDGQVEVLEFIRD